MILRLTDQVGYIPAAYVEIVADAYGLPETVAPPPPLQDVYSNVENEPSLPPPPTLDETEDQIQQTQIVITIHCLSV